VPNAPPPVLKQFELDAKAARKELEPGVVVGITSSKFFGSVSGLVEADADFGLNAL